MIGNTPDFSFVTKFTANGVYGDTVKFVFTNGEATFTPEVEVNFKSPIDGIKVGRLNIVYVHLLSSDKAVAFLPFYNSSGDICIIRGEADPLNGGTVDGSGAYHRGDEVTLEASENTGYEFLKWDDEDTNPTKTFTATTNVTYKAIFTKLKYTLTVPSVTGGTVQQEPIPETGNKYPYGTSVILTAEPDPGYRFKEWSEDGNTNPERQIIVTGDVTYTPVFVKVCSITASVHNDTPKRGKIRLTTPTQEVITNWQTDISYTCDENTELLIEVSPNAGYDFDEWSDGNTSSPRAVTVVGDVTYEALFTPKVYTISASVTPEGFGTVTGGGSFDYYTSTTLTATPNTGYKFVKWVNNGSTNPTQTVLVTGNATWTAEFDYIVHPYVIRVQSVDNPKRGMIRVVGPNIDSGWTYNASETILENTIGVTIQATVYDGYSFNQWSDGNTQNPRVISITQDATYTASFSVNQYAIQTVSDPLAGGTTSGGGLYAYNQSVTLLATPASGYAFLRWVKDGVQVSTNPSYTFNVPHSATTQVYQAKFYRSSGSSYFFELQTDGNGAALGENYYPENEEVDLMAVPDEGWYFDKWTFNGDFLSNDPNITRVACPSTAGIYKAYFLEGTPFMVYGASQVQGLSLVPEQTVVTSPGTTTYVVSKVDWKQDGNTYIPVLADGIHSCAQFDPSSVSIDNLDSVREWARVELDEYEENLLITPLVGAQGAKTYIYSDRDGEHIRHVVLVPTPLKVETTTGGTLSTNILEPDYSLSNETFTLSGHLQNAGWVYVKYADSYVRYTFNLIGNHSSVTKVPNLETYLPDSQVKIQCIPNTGYAFAQWSDGNKENPRVITVDQNKTITAIVGQIVTISTGSTPNGAGRTEGESQYIVGRDATITCVPNTS